MLKKILKIKLHIIKIIISYFCITYLTIGIYDIFLKKIVVLDTFRKLIENFLIITVEIHLFANGLLLPCVYMYCIIFMIFCLAFKCINLKSFLLWFILSVYNFFAIIYLLLHAT